MPPAPKKATTVKERVFVASGLGGQDDNIDTLGVFFDKMRATTVETVHIDDLLTFAACASFFGVVMLETITTVVKSCQKALSGWDYEEEDAEGEWHRGAIASPIAGAEDDPERFSDAYLDVEALSPTEKIDLWRRALANDVQSAVENFDPAAEELIDVRAEDGSVVTVISPPVSPMFQQPSYPYSPVQGHHPQSSRPAAFFPDNEAAVGVHLAVDDMLVDNPDAGANTAMGMGMGGVVMGRGAPDASEFIDWSITSPTDEDQGDGRLSVGGSQDSSHEAELFPYDHHLTQFRAAQAIQEDTSFGREGFFEDNEPAPPEPKLEGDEDDEDEDGEDSDSEDGEEGSDEEEEGEREGGEQSSVDEEEGKREKEKDFMTKQFEDFQEQLRMKRIREYQQNLRLEEKRLAKQKQQQNQQHHQQQPWQQQEPEQDADTRDLKPIGLVYLYSSQTPEDFLHMGEYSMGVYFHEDYRFQHHVCPAINQLVDHAFKNQDCHRLQSIIVDHPDKLYLLEALAKSGFRNEGVRRRGFYSNILSKGWTDVTYFAMLATDWVMDATNPSAPRKPRLQSESLWDEIFSRHQHECDELLRLEEKSSRLKRTTSLETIKEYNMTVDTGASNTASTSASASASTSGDMHESGTSAKRRRIESRRNSIRESVMSARSSSASARSSQVDPSETRWNFNMPSVETAPLSIPSRAGRPIAGPSRARRPSRSGSSVSSISLQSFPSSSSSQWVDLEREG